MRPKAASWVCAKAGGTGNGPPVAAPSAVSAWRRLPRSESEREGQRKGRRNSGREWAVRDSASAGGRLPPVWVNSPTSGRAPPAPEWEGGREERVAPAHSRAHGAARTPPLRGRLSSLQYGQPRRSGWTRDPPCIDQRTRPGPGRLLSHLLARAHLVPSHQPRHRRRDQPPVLPWQTAGRSGCPREPAERGGARRWTRRRARAEPQVVDRCRQAGARLAQPSDRCTEERPASVASRAGPCFTRRGPVGLVELSEPSLALLAVRRRVAQVGEQRPRLQAHHQAGARVELEPARHTLHHAFVRLQSDIRAVAACGL
eukprot:scaffold6313_cov113-Isochrysis_galbana.AAC.2